MKTRMNSCILAFSSVIFHCPESFLFTPFGPRITNPYGFRGTSNSFTAAGLPHSFS